jgi:hypothetical protein
MFRFVLGAAVGWFAAVVYFENDRDVAASFRDLQERADHWMAGARQTTGLSPTNGHRRANRPVRRSRAAD